MFTKPAWMSDQVWRVARTSVQVFFGVFAAALLVVLTGYAETHALDWSALYYQGVVLGVAGVIAYWMNRPK